MTLKKLAVALAGGVLVVGVANATPVDGSLSNHSSEGSFEITLNLQDQVKIWGLDDYSFTNKPVDNKLEDTQDICIYSNSSNGFSTRVVSGNGAFQLRHNEISAADYSLTLALGESVGGEVFTWGVGGSNSGDTINFTAKTSDEVDFNNNPCSDDTGNADLTIALADVNDAVDSGNYVDTVTITISPL